MPSPAIRELAGRLVAASGTCSEERTSELWSVTERLRSSLTRVAGVEGFASLLRRAILLAAEEQPALSGLEVDADGRLQGKDPLPGQAGTGSEAATIVTAQLLGLLVTFIGEPLTRMLVREAWPDTDLDDPTTESEADE